MPREDQLSFDIIWCLKADKDRAIALVLMDVSVNAGEAVEAVAPLARNEFLGRRMKLGDVKLQV
jgi:hypothetical protein